ncbi:MAG: arylamine N-acetyltransferase [Oscillospiraceae bacterium]|nr:arylamine N-acetyltransferase [Oscillospiraceae bacterium]
MDDTMIQKYLDRIGWRGELSLCRETLDKLQTLHCNSVPYENLDILAGVPISMDADDLYDKIVERRRGGYCFELNGLYGWLLTWLGFQVGDFMARFLLDEDVIPMRRHRVLVAELDGERLLCDVGVGIEAPRKTILLEEGVIQNDGFRDYKVERDSFLGWVLWQKHDSGWKRFYSFTEEPQLPKDYIMPSFYCERHPASIFNKEQMIAVKTTDGRRTLDSEIFKIFTPQGVSTAVAGSRDEYTQMLKSYFGIIIENQ